MRIAIPDFVSSTHIALIAAKELGIFRDEGQEVDIVHIPLMHGLESLRDGGVDCCSGAAHAPLMIFPDWRGVKLVAALMQGTHWMFVMRSGLAKRGEIDAVKGRRIAADRGPDLVFKYLLHQAGIHIECDQVEIGPLATDDPNISFGVAAARALADGRVDGLWANALGCELAIQLGAGSVIIDPRRGDGPIGAGNYSFAALATTESNIERNSDRIEATVRAIGRAQSIIRTELQRAAEVARKLFPTTEAELIAQILARDADFYRPSVLASAIDGMNRFATAMGLISSPVPYDQVVATRFRSLWSES
jgi:ABC-type nitrate/sulfonate/bicarbonate transport system substrate-binding protein